MENIRKALERARDREGARRQGPAGPRVASPRLDADLGSTDQISRSGPIWTAEITLDAKHLESNQIIAFDDTDLRTKSFDILRTQVLQSMDQKNWKILGITSPSPGCGKTVTAINLALSIARQPDRSALLVDFDLQKPQVASTLGIHCRTGLVDVLEGRTSLPQSVVRAVAGGYHIMVLPVEAPTLRSSAWMASRPLGEMLHEIRKLYQSSVVILDLPPMLASDDVISLLPLLDCILLVAAVGKSTVAEITECNKHLQAAEVVRLVLNKVPEQARNYYAYHRLHPDK